MKKGEYTDAMDLLQHIFDSEDIPSLDRRAAPGTSLAYVKNRLRKGGIDLNAVRNVLKRLGYTEFKLLVKRK